MSISDQNEDVTCTACNVIDIGTVIQESDCVSQITLSGDHKDEMLNRLTELARSVENDDACDITVQESDNNTSQIDFVFSCAAEKLIFEMRARPLMA
ncbi:DUF406 family protein [Parendozoicomonas sp. Alg238-R29]|uniref:DUF406 family protein n=1 Tax=Parendozoicomonas sp. Alg238-R29 TaxID=2993446 RepID=UPI00248EE0E3|nr:DUF406 family protein [Parendozoicomonas sp. Alg238-R29]